jgi:hypothetical protein
MALSVSRLHGVELQDGCWTMNWEEFERKRLGLTEVLFWLRKTTKYVIQFIVDIIIINNNNT